MLQDPLPSLIPLQDSLPGMTKGFRYRLTTIPFDGLICLAQSDEVSLTISRQASAFSRCQTRSPAGLSFNENGLH
jgi:hypothetical protein